MKRRHWLLLCVPLFLAFAGCATWKDLSTFSLNSGKIKKVALLPLYINPHVGNISLGNPEVKGFQDAWKLEFSAEFKKKILFTNDIKILYPGEDFDITPDMLLEPDYAKIVADLQVDMVMGFTLVQYNEVSQGEAVGEFILSAIIGTGQENMIATFDFHNVYFSQNDLYGRVNIALSGVLPTNESQRKQFMERLVNWINKNHPLSVNYKP